MKAALDTMLNPCLKNSYDPTLGNIIYIYKETTSV